MLPGLQVVCAVRCHRTAVVHLRQTFDSHICVDVRGLSLQFIAQRGSRFRRGGRLGSGSR